MIVCFKIHNVFRHGVWKAHIVFSFLFLANAELTFDILMECFMLDVVATRLLVGEALRMLALHFARCRSKSGHKSCQYLPKD